MSLNMKVSVFQNAGHGLSPDERLARLRGALSVQDMDIVVCPELFMSGYNVGENIRSLAEPVDGAFSEKVAAVARETGTAIIYGYPEREGERCYNSALCVASNGETIANHRKLRIPPGFEGDYFDRGDAMTVFELNGMRCAILVCYDAEFPETVRGAAMAGAQMVFVPTALSENWPSVARQLMPTRAFENGVWLLYANHAGHENGINYLGESCIVAPDGSDVARADKNEQLIWAKIDMAHVETAQKRLPYLVDVVDLAGCPSDGSVI